MSSKSTNLVIRKYSTDGKVESLRERWTLKQMQEYVGGCIELVPTLNPKQGLIIQCVQFARNLPSNQNATDVVHYDIRGNALLVVFEKEDEF